MSQLSNRIADAMINYANAFKETPDNRELAEKNLKKLFVQLLILFQLRFGLTLKLKHKFQSMLII